MPDTTIAVSPKKTIKKKSSATSQINVSASETVTSDKVMSSILSLYSDLLSKMSEAKLEFENLQREIADIKKSWVKEQEDYQRKIRDRDEQQELQRKRELETYDYELRLKRKQEEDEFNDKKYRWEKELQERKEALAKEKQELEQLRKLVAEFENEKEKAIKEACFKLQKELTSQFDTEEKLRLQQEKAEKDILNLKIANLTSENTRLNKEMEAVKRSLEYSTAQLKEIAVKVIESSNTPTTNTSSSQQD